MSEPLRIVDPHIHLWDLSTGLYPHLEKPSIRRGRSNAAIARSYLIDEYLGEGAGVVAIEGAVHVEAFPTDRIREARVLQAVADESPVPIRLVANGDLTAPDFPLLLDRCGEATILRGIRQVVNRHPSADLNYVDVELMARPAFLDGLRLLGARGLSFDLQLYPHQMPEAAALIRHSPDTRIVLNHAGMWADRDLAGWTAWKRGLRLLSEQPNVAVKISGLGMLDADWTVGSIRPLVFETIEAFGIERAMFASNFPVDKLYSSFAAVWQGFADCIRSCSAGEQAAMMRDNAMRIYRF